MNQSPTILIYSDASTSPQNVISVGAFLCLEQEQLDQYAQCTAEILFTTFKNRIVYKKYISNKSTWSEIKTVMNALHTVLKKFGSDINIEIYTDCQSLCDLMGKRKEKLKKNNFMTRSGKTLEHAELYKELFALADKFQIKIFKIKGHDSSTHRLTVHEKIFAMLDKLSRKKLHLILNND